MGIFFRSLDVSAPDVQQRMLKAYSEVLADPIISKKNSPPALWLSALHQFVQKAAPQDAGSDGTVAQKGFYPHLRNFLTVQACCCDKINKASSPPPLIHILMLTERPDTMQSISLVAASAVTSRTIITKGPLLPFF